MNNIKISRNIPIINGFIQIHNNKEKNRNAITLAEVLALPDDFQVTRLGNTGGHSTSGSRYGSQEFIKCPEIGLNTIDDAYNTIKDLA